MRRLAIASLTLLLAGPAFAQGTPPSHGHATRKPGIDASASVTERPVVAPDTNAPGNGWGKKEVPEAKPKTCSYDRAMSDEDIERCRR